MAMDIYSYVVDAAGDSLEVKTTDTRIVDFLKKNGFAKTENNTYELKFHNDESKAKMMGSLRDQGIYFSYGHGWSPSAVFEYLRDQGLLSGKYQRISWTGPGKYQVESI